MGKGRAPCCVKVGLKKGPWTPAEDRKLIAYIQKFGHDNWRALPKHAGLLRCGKSCRLRWINYLRPDIKRGNYTRDEEETIIKLHGLLGNKWSKIASQLPGRTDNEIKNVWHTHLKKKISTKLEPPHTPQDQKESTNVQCSSECVMSSDHHVCEEINSVEEQIDQMVQKDGPSKVGPIEIPIDPNMDIWNMLDDGPPSLDTTQSSEVDSICKMSLNKMPATKLQTNNSAQDKPQPKMSYSPTSSSSSTNNSCRSCLSKLSDDNSMFVEKDPGTHYDEMINLPNEYNMDMWGMLDQSDALELMSIRVEPERKLEAQNAAKEEGESKEDIEDKRWLMDLEYELELRAKKDVQQSLGAEGLDKPLDYLPTIDGTSELDLDPIVAYFQMHPSSPFAFDCACSQLGPDAKKFN